MALFAAYQRVLRAVRWGEPMAVVGELSRRGSFTPGARRSRREPLDSPGSCHPAAGRAPMFQWANRPGSRPAITVRNRHVRVGWPRSRLYFRMAQRTR